MKKEKAMTISRNRRALVVQESKSVWRVVVVTWGLGDVEIAEQLPERYRYVQDAVERVRQIAAS